MMMSARDHVKAQYRLGLRRFCVFRCSGKNSPQRGFPALDAGDKKFNRRLVAPIVLRNEPFGEHVEGFSYYRDGSCSFKIVFK